MAALAAAALWLSACHAAKPPDVSNAHSAGGLAYDVAGEGSWVVLIHGSNLDRRMWDEQMPWLEQSHRVLRYDLRGQGGSDFPNKPFSNYGDLLALMDELGADRATLIGLSAGAGVALDTALAAPGRVRGLVLLSPSVNGYRPAVVPPFFGDLVTSLRAQDYARANEVLLASPLMAVPDRFQEQVRAMVSDNGRLWTIPSSLVEQPTPPTFERLESIVTPALVLVGSDDIEAIQALGSLLEQRLPHAQMVLVPGGRHLLNMTSPEAFREFVERFLRAD